jgi:hypothetical protein
MNIAYAVTNPSLGVTPNTGWSRCHSEVVMGVYYSGTSTRARRVNSVVGFAAGAVFVVVGLLGFTVSGGHPAAGHEGGALLGLFQVNVLHNVVHLAIGAVMIAAAIAGARAAKVTNTVVGAVYLLVGVAGLVVAGSAADLLALNGSDNILHLGLGAVLLGVGLAADRD